MLLIIVNYTLPIWEKWTFKMISPQSQMIFSKTTMYSCLIWLDFNARCYWILSLPRTRWRATEGWAKHYFSSRIRYWTHCIGGANVFGFIWLIRCCWEENLKWLYSLQQISNRISILKYWYLRSFHSMFHFFAETFITLNTQPSIMKDEHCIKIAISRRKLFFSDFFGRPSFLKQQYK